MSLTLHYCHMPLARNSGLRESVTWLNSQFASDQGIVYVMWNQQHLVLANNREYTPARIPISDAGLVLGNTRDVLYLGHEGTAPVFAADLGDLDQQRAEEVTGFAIANARFEPLRVVTNLMDSGQVSILAYAQALSFWHQNNRFCGRCGKPTTSQRGGHMLACNQCN